MKIIYYYILFIFGYTFSIAYACTVPLYQYALQQWQADPYEIYVFHKGPLSLEYQNKLDDIRKASQDENFKPNVILRSFDLEDSQNKAAQKLWESQSKSELPWMIIKYPRFSKILWDLWAGSLKSADIKTFLDSPVRKNIARHILKGYTAVWLFLESGNQKQDQEALKILEKQLKKMSEILKVEIPIIYQEETIAKDQKVKFSLLKLSRNDPREAFFIQMLLNTEEDLKKIIKPMAFPIFGRGRLLYAFVGEGISEENIQAVCEFIVGWCSCEVKELNPGVDLLMSVNWDNVLYNGSDELFEESQIDSKITEESITKHDDIKPGKVEEIPEISEKPIEYIGETKLKKIDEKAGLAKIAPKSVDINSIISNNTDQVNSSEDIQQTDTIASTLLTGKGPSGNLVRNILIVVFIQVFAIAAVTFIILWRRRQKA